MNLCNLYDCLSLSLNGQTFHLLFVSLYTSFLDDLILSMCHSCTIVPFHTFLSQNEQTSFIVYLLHDCPFLPPYGQSWLYSFVILFDCPLFVISRTHGFIHMQSLRTNLILINVASVQLFLLATRRPLVLSIYHRYDCTLLPRDEHAWFTNLLSERCHLLAEIGKRILPIGHFKLWPMAIFSFDQWQFSAFANDIGPYGPYEI